MPLLFFFSKKFPIYNINPPVLPNLSCKHSAHGVHRGHLVHIPNASQMLGAMAVLQIIANGRLIIFKLRVGKKWDYSTNVMFTIK